MLARAMRMRPDTRVDDSGRTNTLAKIVDYDNQEIAIFIR